MTDLRVDYQALDSARTALARVATELDRASQKRDELASAWGGREVADGMRGFANDWDRHRDQLIGSLREVAELCDAMACTFRSVESQLNHAIDPSPVLGPPAPPTAGTP